MGGVCPAGDRGVGVFCVINEVKGKGCASAKEGDIDKQVKRRKQLVHVFLDYRGFLKAMLMDRLGNEADVDEVLQDTYLRISEMGDPDSVVNPRAFVFRVASNLGVDRGRDVSRRRERFMQDEKVAGRVASEQPSPERIAINRENLRNMREVLLELPPKCRTAFLLSRRDGMTYKEIGVHLGVSDNMVKKHLVRALAHCRKRMPRPE